VSNFAHAEGSYADLVVRMFRSRVVRLDALNLGQIILKKVTAAASRYLIDKLDFDTDEMTWLVNS